METWQNGEEVTVTVDGQSKTVPSVDGYAKAEFTIENVHLWDGVDDPYLYTATATLPAATASPPALAAGTTRSIRKRASF